MLIIPAVDILDHKVVQLVGGIPGSEKVVIPDPLEVARSWIDKGAKYLHIVDLDGAFGREDNIPVIKEIVRSSDVPVEVGGGIRSESVVRELVDAGADRVIVGTKAIKDPEWLAGISGRYPGRIALAMDTKGGRIVMKGWQEAAPISIDEMFEGIRDLPLAGILNTNVDVEGKGEGIDVRAVEDFIRRSPHQVIASGGVTSEEDAELLDRAGAIAAVVGVAIYTGMMSPWEWEDPWMAYGHQKRIKSKHI